MPPLGVLPSDHRLSDYILSEISLRSCGVVRHCIAPTWIAKCRVLIRLGQVYIADDLYNRFEFVASVYLYMHRGVPRLGRSLIVFI